MVHTEKHRSHRAGWLRAAVLGANDGIVSTASLIIGVAAANASIENILLAGVAGLVAGAMSMAAGEYVSVSSQADTEQADITIEKRSLAENYESEKAELSQIYQERGLEEELAHTVADKLMEHDALAAHVRDDIGISESAIARPVQAALYSAITFTVGAAFPLLVTWLSPQPYLLVTVSLSSLFFLTSLGAIAARVGGAPVWKGASRVAFWGIAAMVMTAVVGRLFDVIV
jgi:VIT1/CCC1 family predicted Fe2+/Mn2+ transporter